MKNLIKKILREQTETVSLCVPIKGWSVTQLVSGQKFGDCRRKCVEKDVDDNCIEYDNCGSKHAGNDLGAKSGTPLLAAADGTVTAANSDDGGDCGGLIMIKHAGDIETKYCHCSKVSVIDGQEVKQGEVIGNVGGDTGDPGAGNSSHAHLHYEVIVNGKAVDPAEGGYLDKECGVELADDDPMTLLLWLNRGEVKSKEDERTAEELIALLPDCYKKTQKDKREDGLVIYKLWQWGYIESTIDDLKVFYPPDQSNIIGLLDYQKKYGLKELPVDIVNGCRIPQETLDHINANEKETILREL